ncbi:hypothetical protein [Mesorhizobium sp. L103C131B0]|uniref:hypothetical protein n=1 Tax=Mesorhizobium sp. L103C131B0 TaxID=1287089 RepID=UPI0003CFEB06|nr:hypothetical protein [Mesorhizobium sp. L103C131B0]ESZ65827.1 hypothetical protein X729_02810 [Mesorhizobium sp. L103C131B0]
MLQINTGKLFARGVGRTNRLRGVLYSNLYLRDEPIVTAAGTLLGTNSLRENLALIYELDERIEEEPVGPGVLVSHGIEPFLVDFSAVASFGFDAVVSPEAALVDRLLSAKPSLASYAPPRDFLKRTFKDQIWLTPEDSAKFVSLVRDLLALDRRRFLAAMRAIRTYVAGVHRLLDDLGVAYTLMVSAIESLAQDFDGYQSGWDDVDERKRKPVDVALSRASARTGQRVREAILSAEHVLLSRRYRAFVTAHLDKSYFRNFSIEDGTPVAAYELDEALRQAYALRSRYLHNLRVLPDSLTHPFGHWEVTYVDRKAVLTFQGLARLTRTVIKEFIARGQKVEFEEYNYRHEQAGIRLMEMASQYWVGKPLQRADHAKIRLEGLLSQLVGVMSNDKDAQLTDLRPMLSDVERMMAKASARNKPAMFALYVLFNLVVSSDLRMPGFDAFVEKHHTAFDAPSIEGLVALTFLDKVGEWPLEAHRQQIDQYFEVRATPKGLHAPRTVDAAMCLALAERYREAREYDQMRAMVSNAVESLPGNAALLELERAFREDAPITWRTVLFPPPPPSS